MFTNRKSTGGLAAAAAEFCPLAENQSEKNSARPRMEFPRRRRKKISPVKLNAFLITSSPQNNR